MSDQSMYNEDYYEHGRRKKISGYQDYSWMPTRSISEATTIVERIKFNSVLEFGCAKGFLVHALSLLGKAANGIDISRYAIDNCLPQVKDKVFLYKPELIEDSTYGVAYDLIIAKDVLEHLTEEEIKKVLHWFYLKCSTLFIVVPLGDNDLFRIREYELDKTHLIAKDEEWWLARIKEAGFKIEIFDYKFGNVKEKWVDDKREDYKYGNGFFVAKNPSAQ